MLGQEQLFKPFILEIKCKFALTKKKHSQRKNKLKALAVNDGRARLIVLLLADPHLLKG